jgi:outer membrane protein
VKSLIFVFLSALPSLAQSTLTLQNPIDAPVGSFAPMDAEPVPAPPNPESSSPNLALRLSVKDAEAIALKNNPAISEARLIALASHQVTREVRSNLWPQATANLTGVDAHDDSRISAGGLNNPIIYARAAAGTTVSQLITDFGHTANLVASARFHELAEGQNARATREQILLAVDQAFYAALQSHAVLKVAEQTVTSRQLLSAQVSALTKSKLKSGLDLSFANVNLSQAKLLYLDALNNDKASMAAFSSILGYGTVEEFDLVPDPGPFAPPPDDINQLLTDAFSKRPEILSMEFEAKSAEKLHRADRDQFFPTISALGAIGDAPFRDDRISSWYGAAGVNVQIPIFNGLLSTAKSHESDLQARAAEQRVLDLRNRISRDVRTSWLNANTAYERVSVSQQLLSQANQALDLSQTRYKLGLGSIVELSQAQLQQTQAQIGSAQAGYEYRLELSVLRYQTMGL